MINMSILQEKIHYLLIKQSQMIEQAEFRYSSLQKAFEKQKKTQQVNVLKSLSFSYK